MRILISGSSGLIGSAVAAAYRAGGDTVHSLVRGNRTPAPGDVRWDYTAGAFDAAAAEGAGAVIHLAGYSIADGRLDEKHRAVVRASRVEATQHLVTHLLRLQRKPRVLVAASAVGYYGDRGEEELTEESAPGSNFLAQLAQEWEAAAARAAEGGIRVVLLRFGVVLSPEGGALAKMLTPFRFGLGGRVGSGRQWWPWISLPDAVALVRHAVENEALGGAVNAVASAVRNAEFTRVLARVLKRPALFPAPAFALRLALGQTADLLLLGSQRVIPARLQAMGYRFLHPELEAALRAVLGRPGRVAAS